MLRRRWSLRWKMVRWWASGSKWLRCLFVVLFETKLAKKWKTNKQLNYGCSCGFSSIPEKSLTMSSRIRSRIIHGKSWSGSNHNMTWVWRFSYSRKMSCCKWSINCVWGFICSCCNIWLDSWKIRLNSSRKWARVSSYEDEVFMRIKNVYTLIGTNVDLYLSKRSHVVRLYSESITHPMTV